jgi:tyrosyl-tRNA synthetase
MASVEALFALNLETKLALVRRPPTEEIVTEEELVDLLSRSERPRHYIGLEISGPLHLGSLILTGFKINDFIKAGINCRVFLADWHSFINGKFGGDWEKIQRIAREYYADAYSFYCPGVEIEFGSELYTGNDEYWKNLVRLCKQVTLARDTRCLTIMGRTTKDKLDMAQYFYPPMQANDIHAMDLDIVHSGIDQRKVHMLAREVFPALGWKKPVAVHHHLLGGLGEPIRQGIDENEKLDTVISSKMSKSRPETAIFIHDTEEDIGRKMSKAWCPERTTAGNPVLDYAKEVVFHETATVTVERPSKYGGDVTYGSYAALERDFLEGKLHPSDLKSAVAAEINRMVAPLRAHFHGARIIDELSME